MDALLVVIAILLLIALFVATGFLVVILHDEQSESEPIQIRLGIGLALITTQPEGTRRTDNVMAFKVTVNDTIEQPIIVRDADNNILTGAEVRFASSDSNVLAVENAGGGNYKATAVGLGNAAVLVEVEAGETDITFSIDVEVGVGAPVSAVAGEAVITVHDAPVETPTEEQPTDGGGETPTEEQPTE